MTRAYRPTAREWLVRVFERGNRVHGRREDGGYDLPYTGPNWFLCADGKVFSVVAGWGTYCSPRPDWPQDWGGAPKDYTGPYTAVEVWFPGDEEPEGHVEADRLWAYVNEHGGVVDYLDHPMQPEEAGWTK